MTLKNLRTVKYSKTFTVASPPRQIIPGFFINLNPLFMNLSILHGKINAMDKIKIGIVNDEDKLTNFKFLAIYSHFTYDRTKKIEDIERTFTGEELKEIMQRGIDEVLWEHKYREAQANKGMIQMKMTPERTWLSVIFIYALIFFYFFMAY